MWARLNHQKYINSSIIRFIFIVSDVQAEPEEGRDHGQVQVVLRRPAQSRKPHEADAGRRKAVPRQEFRVSLFSFILVFFYLSYFNRILGFLFNRCKKKFI